MIGNIVQYVLYAMLFLAVAMSVFGFYLTFHARRGKVLESETAVALAGLSLLAGISPYVGLFGMYGTSSRPWVVSEVET